MGLSIVLAVAQAGLSSPGDAEELVATGRRGRARPRAGRAACGPATSLAAVAPPYQRPGCCRDVPAMAHGRRAALAQGLPKCFIPASFRIVWPVRRSPAGSGFASSVPSSPWHGPAADDQPDSRNSAGFGRPLACRQPGNQLTARAVEQAARQRGQAFQGRSSGSTPGTAPRTRR